MPNQEFVQGNNTITIDIVDRAGTVVGPGPIVTCLDITFDSLLSQPGTFTARFPANDPMLALVQLKKHFLYVYLHGEPAFYGMAETSRNEIDANGEHILVLGGRDQLGELSEHVLVNVILDDESAPAFNAPYRIMLHSLSSPPLMFWGFSGQEQTETGVYTQFVGENILSALTRIAEHIGESFRLNSARVMAWIGTTPDDSGVRAIGGAGDSVEAETNPFVCFIQNLTERRDASRMISTIYPTGSGIGETYLDLNGTSRTAPAGFTLDEANNAIISDDAVTYLGKAIGRRVNFKDIRPLFNTDADMISAKDYLFDAGLAFLKRNDSVDDVVEYDLDVVGFPRRYVKVGDAITVEYYDESYSLSEAMTLMGIRTAVSRDGTISDSLTVKRDNQWGLAESSRLVAQIEEGEIFAAHPQIDANSYWENFNELVGDHQTDHIAELPFFLSEEVATIRQVLFTYKVDRPLVATKSYAYASANTAQNAAGNTGDTAATIDGTAATVNGTAATIDGADVTISNAGVTINTTGSTDVGTTTAPTIATRSDSSGTTAETVYSDTNYNDIGEATHGPINWAPDPSIHHHDVDHHVHDISTHQHVYSHDHPVSAEHGHTAVDHYHTAISHSHTSPSHSHTSPSHAHTSPVHSHSSPQHVHAAPALTESFALVRVPALTSYVMADLEYRVNGGAWAALDSGIPVAGGYYQADITAAVQNPNGMRRPIQEYNLIEVRCTTAAANTGKSAMIRAKVGIRSTIQSIVQYS
jgi:hypothetical protein